VSDHPSESAGRSPAPPDGGRLDSWKEIAAYLRRDVTTVRRWEKREGLPVHRHIHDRLGTVYAFKHEVDLWWHGRRHDLGNGGGNGRATAGDLVSDVQNGADRGSSPRQERLAWTLAAILFLIAVAATVALFVRNPPAVDPAEYRFSIVPPESGGFGTSAVSPDGRHIAFTVSNSHDMSRLWLRRLDSVEAHPLAGTDGAAFPFWSPDSRTVGFFADDKLKTIPLSGGSARTLAEAPEGRGGTWSRDDVILFAPRRDGAVYRVAASGGVASPVTTVDTSRHRGHLWPEFLPDGRHFVYLADSVEAEHHGLYVGSLDTSDSTPLVRARSNAISTHTGALLFVRDGALVSQHLAPGSMELSGGPTIVADRVAQPYGLDHKGDFSVSSTGVLAFRRGGSPVKELVWLDRRGERRGHVPEPADYSDPVLSPDGSRIAVSVFDSIVPPFSSDVWLLDVSTGARSRLTFDPAADFEPVWSPDGADVLFSSNRSGTVDLYRRSASGAGPDQLLLASAIDKHSESVSPDGRFLTYASLESKTRWDAWLLPLTGDRRPVPLLNREFSEGQTQISPDGRWMAYTSYESGRMEVFVRSFPSGDGKWQISSAGGADPRWRRDGRELFFIAASGMLTAVRVEIGPDFKPGAPRPLFDTKVNHLWDDARNHYDVSVDGDRFLVAMPVENVGSLPLTVVVNSPSLGR
jgi:Tol biopolymer transport system component